MLNISINLESQINQLANDARQPVDAFLGRLIADYIEEKADIIEADEIYQRIQSGQETTVPFSQILRR
jgi:predicted DNA-binding protein